MSETQPPPPLVRIVSWNLLGADNLRANAYLYERCHPSALPWPRRKPSILDALAALNADIVALQEVENFAADLEKPLLSRCGLEGVYKQRTGGQADGVALCWRGARFSLLHLEALEYAHVLTRGVTSPDEDEKLRKHNVGLVGVFLDRLAQREIVVATTHLLFNPKRGIVKLKQLSHLLTRTDALRRMSLGSRPASAARHSGTAGLASSPRTADARPKGGEDSSNGGGDASGGFCSGGGGSGSNIASGICGSGSSGPAPGERPCVVLGDLNLTPSSLLHAFVRGVKLHALPSSEGEWDGHEAEVRMQRKGHHQSPPPPARSSSAPGGMSSGVEGPVDATHPLAGELLSACAWPCAEELQP